MNNLDKTWIEISKSALIHNWEVFKNIVGKKTIIAPPVKGNSYGHGILECAKILEEIGAEYLSVDSLDEAKKLRENGIKANLLILGYVPSDSLEEVNRLKSECTVYNKEIIERMGQIGKPFNIHLKIETGTHRQGIEISNLKSVIKLLKKYPNIQIKGVSTHFADIEDYMNRDFAELQIKRFKKAIKILEESGINPPLRHSANSAATLLMPDSYFNFVRPGIAIYGLWPSEKTKLSAEKMGKKITLKPVLNWKSRIAQIKEVKKEDPISYGRTYTMPHDGKNRRHSCGILRRSSPKFKPK